MPDHSFLNFSDIERNLFVAGTSRKLGRVNEQTVFAVKPVPGCDIELPFGKTPFTALIRTTGSTTEADMRRAGWQLLQHGLRHGLCHGPYAERMSEILDELIDEFTFTHGGETAFSSCHEGEEFSETLEYFLLPSGLGSTGLILVLGSDEELGGALGEFDLLVNSGDVMLQLENDDVEYVTELTEVIIEAEPVGC